MCSGSYDRKAERQENGINPRQSAILQDEKPKSIVIIIRITARYI
jgi:hypothetical protein